jgi:hypothetical protein
MNGYSKYKPANENSGAALKRAAFLFYMLAWIFEKKK